MNAFREVDKKAMRDKKLNKRYQVEYSHKNCHPETCSCQADYRIYDNKEFKYSYYDDNQERLQRICDTLNKDYGQNNN